MSYRGMFWLFIGMMVLWLTSCSTTPPPIDEPTPSATPERPQMIDVIHQYNPDGFLNLTLNTVSLLNPPANPDIQVLAVLADGNEAVSYVLSPSNQPGVPQSSLDLSDYPLQIAPQAERTALWIVAVTHTAYPISENIGQDTVSTRLANAFNNQIPDITGNLAAELVSQNGDVLLGWFGEVEILGELTLMFSAADNWSTGRYTVQSADGQLQLTYDLATSPEDIPPTPIPAIVEAVTPTDIPSIIRPTLPPPSIFEAPITGYRRVVSETFDQDVTTYTWFVGRDDTYSATIENNSYQIGLTQTDPNRGDIALSWGSLQDLIFDDYIVRARVRVLDDSLMRYGLWLHYLDDFNFVFFGIENTGRYRVARFENSYTELVPWTLDTQNVIDRGASVNDFEITLQDDVYTFAVNGETLTTTSDNAFDQGRIAFFCYSEVVPATCRLERFEVWVPQDAQFPLPANTE